MKVNLPPGCYGTNIGPVKFTARDSSGNVKPGGSVDMPDSVAPLIKKSRNGQLGLISGTQALNIGTRTGKRCVECKFLAQGWATACPKCGAPVTEES